ncbi:uncharacterized protein LOC108605008 [Drosophila busckii]|uniref:uncharacterized protein LOC108605008 n=1 Tax=Drosophila busckii TaxID=30019 RepID=UPI00083EEB58|nr:uncharacterized protein LOC108605008 [Drosophila busckii]
MAANHMRLLKILLSIFALKLCFLMLLYYQHAAEQEQQEQLQRRQRYMETLDKLLIDTREKPSLEQRLAAIREELPAFPLEEMLRHERLHGVPKGCARTPPLYDIKFHNDYWQQAPADNLTYYLFGAYYDNRAAVEEAPLVRILAMSNRYGVRGVVKFPQVYCQLWFKDNLEPLIVNVTDHKILWIFGGGPKNVYPTLLSCALPKSNNKTQLVPQMVSLVAKRCQAAKNLLRVVNNNKRSSQPVSASNRNQTELKFMICVKAMDFPYVDLSWRLIEWLEMMRLLGAHKVVFYDAQMHANMSKVIRHYMQDDFVELHPMSHGRGEPHATPHFAHFAMEADYFNRILNEMIPYNDCFYRNMYNYDYIGVFDIDEIIMPLGNLSNWSQLIDVAQRAPDYQRDSSHCKQWASFCFRNVYFPRYAQQPKIFKYLPSFYYMLQHVDRVAEHSDRYSATKCLHSTRYVEGLHNHFPFFYTKRASCDAKSVPIQYAQMQHYREPDNKTHLLHPVRDDNIWRFQPQLQQRVFAKYEQLGFLPTLEQLAAAQAARKRNDEQQLKAAIGATH